MARGFGTSGRRRTQLLDAAIALLSDAGYEMAAQKLSDFRETEWDLGEEQAVMSAVSVGHFAAFVRDRDLVGRLPMTVRTDGEIGLDWAEGDARRLSLTFLEDGRIAYEATSAAARASLSGVTTANGIDDPLAQAGGWEWVRSAPDKP